MGLQKHTHAMTARSEICVWGAYICKMGLQNTSACDDTTMRCFFGWNVFVFCNNETRFFEVLFTGVSTRYGLRTIIKYLENANFIFCYSFQNLRLGSIKCRILMLPNEDFERPNEVFLMRFRSTFQPEQKGVANDLNGA